MLRVLPPARAGCRVLKTLVRILALSSAPFLLFPSAVVDVTCPIRVSQYFEISYSERQESQEDLKILATLMRRDAKAYMILANASLNCHTRY